MKNRISLGGFLLACTLLITAAMYANRAFIRSTVTNAGFYSIRAKDSQPYLLTDLYKCNPAGIKITENEKANQLNSYWYA